MIYKTDNLNLSAFLIAKGHKLLNYEKTDRKYIFIFSDSELLHKNNTEFINNALIGVQDMLGSIKSLKNLIYS